MLKSGLLFWGLGGWFKSHHNKIYIVAGSWFLRKNQFTFLALMPTGTGSLYLDVTVDVKGHRVALGTYCGMSTGSTAHVGLFDIFIFFFSLQASLICL